MATTVSHLFVFARAAGSDPRENFTTEALAEAIRADAALMLLALARLGISTSTGSARAFRSRRWGSRWANCPWAMPSETIDSSGSPADGGRR